LIHVLTDILREKDKAIKRSAIACLGELLFYVATQESRGDEWSVPSSTTVVLVKCLKNEEDWMVQQYAVQTIENVSDNNYN
jgi:serine/threonine-protein kinase ULK4